MQNGVLLLNGNHCLWKWAWFAELDLLDQFSHIYILLIVHTSYVRDVRDVLHSSDTLFLYYLQWKYVHLGQCFDSYRNVIDVFFKTTKYNSTFCIIIFLHIFQWNPRIRLDKVRWNLVFPFDNINRMSLKVLKCQALNCNSDVRSLVKFFDFPRDSVRKYQ